MGKGANWERDLCKDLSEWVQGSKTPYIYWRTNGSGATFTRNFKVGSEFAGDIHAILPEGNFLTDIFVIEAKNGYPNYSLDKHLKYNKSDELKSFWEQVINDAIKTNKEPMLIYNKKGLSCSWIGISENIFNRLINLINNIRYQMVYFPELNNYKKIFLFNKKEFFDIVKPKDIQELKENM